MFATTAVNSVHTTPTYSNAQAFPANCGDGNEEMSDRLYDCCLPTQLNHSASLCWHSTVKDNELACALIALST